MTFNDIFKSNFLENITGVSIFDILTAFILAFCLLAWSALCPLSDSVPR